jgi:hypothetical protein
MRWIKKPYVDTRRKWHKWFAWYPVEVKKEMDFSKMVWLEFVERQVLDWESEYNHRLRVYRIIKYGTMKKI